MSRPRFALIGAAGYVAPKHLTAIKEVGGELVAALDPHDSVGRLDAFFPDCQFFTEFERFDRHVEKLTAFDRGPDYVVVCSPNYLHDAHCRWAMRVGANVICEKPLVVTPGNLNGLARIESLTGKRVFSILQLRLHPGILALKEKVAALAEPASVNIRYITPRGAWYDRSWKGDPEKSGGVQMNIGVHLFDMLGFVFGRCIGNQVDERFPRHIAGRSRFSRGNATWFLSINAKHLPPGHSGAFRRMTVNGEEVDLSEGFSDLHTESYRQILAGNGYGIEDCRPAIGLVSSL